MCEIKTRPTAADWYEQGMIEETESSVTVEHAGATGKTHHLVGLQVSMQQSTEFKLTVDAGGDPLIEGIGSTANTLFSVASGPALSSLPAVFAVPEGAPVRVTVELPAPLDQSPGLAFPGVFISMQGYTV